MADTGRTFWADGFWADDFWAVGFWAADEPVTVPDVDDPGTTQAAATAAIEGVGLVVAVVTAYSSTIPAGEVISQAPAAGSSVAPGSTVTITVSLGEAPIPPAQDTVTGGWWPDYDHARRLRLKRQRELEELEAEAKLIQDQIDRDIYLAQRKLEAEEADKADLQRLQKLADQYAGKVAELPQRARLAILNAQDARTRNALQQMRREIDRMVELEELAVALLLMD